MKIKNWFWYGVYLVVAIIGIWLLTKLWIPSGYVIAGHDSGLAINSGEFLKTRFFAWDDRIDFGSDNSPHFGSVIMHSIDYLISIIAKVPYAGNHLAVFFWISGIFIFSFIFSYSLREMFGKYFAVLFPVFLTFNFFILQSVFILERAKYELIFSTLFFLTLVLKILFKENSNILKYSIMFSLMISIFNGGGWFGLPLYGGLFVIVFVAFLFVIAMGIKEKSFLNLKKLLIFYAYNLLFYVLLNAYSILPYVSTLINSDFAKVINQGTINAGYEWLNYISRGSSFLNLFRMQGIPDWYLTGYGVNSDHAYAGLYLSNALLVLISFLIPIIAFSGLLFPSKDKTKKYIISYFLILLLVSIFFVSGTNSPIGFIYEFFYTRIPGFNIFRSPYYKFAPAYLIAFSFLLSYSLSKIISFLRFNNILKLGLVLLIIFGWFKYHKIIFSSNDIFTWQPNKSTLVQIPNYVNEFGNWITENKINGRILITPPFDKTWRDDSYKWGYWSLSPLPSLLSKNANFVANDLNIYAGEEGWVNELYSTLLLKDKDNFFEVANRLGIKHILWKEDYLVKISGEYRKSEEQNLYINSINWFSDNGYIVLTKKIGQWSLFSINNAVIKDIDSENAFVLTENIFSIPKAQEYFETQIHDDNYNDGSWVDSKYTSSDLKSTFKKVISPLNCESCQIENLGRYADIPVVRILPNSPLYQIKQHRNDKSIAEAKDDQAKIGVYLGLIMIKFSEVRSMYELDIEKEFIDKGLKDISSYLQIINDLIIKSPKNTTNFYLASRVFETLNPLQRFFRDYIYSPDINFEKSFVKDDILKILWQGVSIKKLFDPITEQGDRWNYEKYYNLSSLPNSIYSLLIDSETLPVDLQGNKIKPSKIILTNSNNELKLENTLDRERFLKTNTASFVDESEVRFYFSDLPDLFKSIGGKRLDFPEGTRGCLEGQINNFNSSRMYRLSISSIKDIDNLRLYIKSGDKNISNNGFLRGDIEVDIVAGLDQRSFEYIYSPSINSDDPQIFLCRRDESIPLTANITAKEIYSPIVYSVNDLSKLSSEVQPIIYTKINPTKYAIDIGKLDKDYVLVFNSRYNGLWELYNDNFQNDDNFVQDHFIVDGYANGWLIKKGRSQNLVLVYKPQDWYEKGKMISLISVLILLTMLGYNSYFRIKNKDD